MIVSQFWTDCAFDSRQNHEKYAKDTDTGTAHRRSGIYRSRKFVETRFGKIAYVDRGTGPAALFLHGLLLNGFQWRGVLPRLSHRRRCIAPDFLGLGYTDARSTQELAPILQADMLVAFLDARPSKLSTLWQTTAEVPWRNCSSRGIPSA